jgi:two-component system phosphate regulon sensor histidine kinase PhoR
MRIRHRLLLALIGAALAGSVLVSAGAIGLIRIAVKESFAERVRAETALLAEWIGDSASLDPQDFAVRTAARLGFRVTLIGVEGTVVGDSAKDRSGVLTMDNHAGRPEVQAARLGGTGESFRRSASTNREYFYSARSLGGEGPVRYVRIALPASEVYRAQTRHAWLVVPLLLGTMVLLIVPGYAAVRRLSRPMERMADVVERSEEGILHIDLPRDGGREIERLGLAVKRMQGALLGKLGELDAERAVFASVISGMREGLVVVGADRRVRLVNDALCHVLEIDFDPRGHLLEEVVRHPLVLQDVGIALEEGREVGGSVIRIPGSGRSFQLQVTPLSGEPSKPADAALALLFDVTKLERLESVRREFVANVSHELRTPLTSIAASVETLIDGAADDLDDARRFLEIIRKHTQRMGDLIEDLTDLSLIETGAVSLTPRDLDVAEVVHGLVEHFAPLAADRGVRIQVDLPSPFPLWADRRRLEQILTNLLDNAVKFNKPGGTVAIRGSRGDRGSVLTIEDSGIGIPADSLEKIFHRFHQVSRDRSRAVRGTGLGLAIVKHLMRLHDGSVTVSSELGEGSRFTLEFPDVA